MIQRIFAVTVPVLLSLVLIASESAALGPQGSKYVFH